MKIETGTPPQHGRYVCYLPGVGFATVIRIWCDGQWYAAVHQPVAGRVAGWIGPLPPMEYDL